MHLTLTSLSTSEIPEIQIAEPLFAIGRSEEPFVSFPRSVVSRLSKRHAKIFEQDGVVYLVDLGSRNGTTLNGGEVAEVPQRLSDGDEIQMGGLSFRVELKESEATAVMEYELPPDFKLVLSPASDDQGLTSIVVTQLPFLVHRSSDVFSQYLVTAPDQVGFISKRHAHFFYRTGAIWIEDLGSTNGTFLNGNRLDEGAAELKNDDIIAFGGEYFVYRTRIVYSMEEADSTVIFEIDEVEQSSETVFVDSPTSFVDIFVKQNSKNPGSSDSSVKAPREFAIERSKPVGTKAEPVVVKSEPIVAQRKGVKRSKKNLRVLKWPVLGFGLVGVLAVAAFYFLRTPSIEQLNEMIDREEFHNAAVTANSYLRGIGDDPALVRIATLATLKGHLPVWIEQIRTHDLLNARQTVETMRMLGANNRQDDAHVELLGRVVDMYEFLDGNTTSGTAERAELSHLIAWWRADIEGRTKTLDELAGYVPEFRFLRRQILARLRTMMVRHQNLLGE
ncbi:MAG: FHA domain-containing protein [Gammaproteobacteria bacterium]|nr:FHA domain-containing protein [Gammaproteobacteria bacterium]